MPASIQNHLPFIKAYKEVLEEIKTNIGNETFNPEKYRFGNAEQIGLSAFENQVSEKFGKLVSVIEQYRAEDEDEINDLKASFGSKIDAIEQLNDKTEKELAINNTIADYISSPEYKSGAATTIQSKFRQRAAKKHVADLKELKEDEKTHESEEINSIIEILKRVHEVDPDAQGEVQNINQKIKDGSWKINIDDIDDRPKAIATTYDVLSKIEYNNTEYSKDDLINLLYDRVRFFEPKGAPGGDIEKHIADIEELQRYLGTSAATDDKVKFLSTILLDLVSEYQQQKLEEKAKLEQEHELRKASQHVIGKNTKINSSNGVEEFVVVGQKNAYQIDEEENKQVSFAKVLDADYSQLENGRPSANYYFKINHVEGDREYSVKSLLSKDGYDALKNSVQEKYEQYLFYANHKNEFKDILQNQIKDNLISDPSIKDKTSNFLQEIEKNPNEAPKLFIEFKDTLKSIGLDVSNEKEYGLSKYQNKLFESLISSNPGTDYQDKIEEANSVRSDHKSYSNPLDAIYEMTLLAFNNDKKASQKFIEENKAIVEQCFKEPDQKLAGVARNYANEAVMAERKRHFEESQKKFEDIAKDRVGEDKNKIFKNIVDSFHSNPFTKNPLLRDNKLKDFLTKPPGLGTLDDNSPTIIKNYSKKGDRNFTTVVFNPHDETKPDKGNSFNVVRIPVPGTNNLYATAIVFKQEGKVPDDISKYIKGTDKVESKFFNTENRLAKDKKLLSEDRKAGEAIILNSFTTYNGKDYVYAKEKVVNQHLDVINNFSLQVRSTSLESGVSIDKLAGMHNGKISNHNDLGHRTNLTEENLAKLFGSTRSKEDTYEGSDVSGDFDYGETSSKILAQDNPMLKKIASEMEGDISGFQKDHKAPNRKITGNSKPQTK